MLAHRLCAEDWLTNPLQGIAPTVVPDYAVLRMVDARGAVTTKADIGARCRGVTNAETCKLQLDEARAIAAPGALSSYFLLVQRADSIEVVDTLRELLAFLGPIDTPQEAALVVAGQGYRAQCDVSTFEVGRAAIRITALSGNPECGVKNLVRGSVLRVTRTGVLTSQSESIIAEGHDCASVGRRPERWVGARGTGASPLAAYFAQLAELEAASVVAFERIEHELRTYGAPAALVQRAARARQDEVRHAAMMKALALRFGGVVREPVVPPAPVRALVAFARDNATEGTVRETYGALMAQAQGERATDPHVARALRIIAADERRHAALSWDVAAWVEPQLTAAERASLGREADAAYDELMAAGSSRLDVPSRALAGLPSESEARGWVDGLRHQLRGWREAA